MTTIRCPFCGRQIRPSKKGHIPSHLSSGGVRCIAVGLDFEAGARMRASIDAALTRTARAIAKSKPL